MDLENLRVERADDVVRITIDRPQVLNALNIATLRELGAVIDAIDDDARVVIITGGGEKSFVAGADISEMAEYSPVEAERFSRLGHEVLRKLEALEAPVIAEVNGYALGGGCEIMLACDFAIASDNARLGLPEVGLGVIPGFGGTIRLSRRVGDARARQLLYTGAQLKAADALAVGLVNEVVPFAELRGTVDALAARIKQNAPRAVAWAKRSARLAEETDLGAASTFEQHAFGLCFSTQDQKEGMKAFLEKRKPGWKGR